MSKKVILREWLPLQKSAGFLVEDKRPSGGFLTLKGPMQRAEAPNQNKRVYPREILHREFENYMKLVKERRAVGELDHPETTTVSLDKVSHVVTEMWWEADTWMGAIEILNSPKGKIAQQLHDDGITLGISSRGLGSTSTMSSGLDKVQEDFVLVCFDLVQEPSTHQAFMVSESVQHGGANLSRADRINRVLNTLKGNK